MIRDPLTVLLDGLDEPFVGELEDEDGMSVIVAKGDPFSRATEADVVVTALRDAGPLEVLERLRIAAPHAAVVVLTDASRAADGAIALHAGAEDHLVIGEIGAGLLPRVVRYAATERRLRRELAMVDDETGLANLRGFAPIAEHHLRVAERSRSQVVFLFVRLEDLAAIRADLGLEEAHRTVAESAQVILEAVRASDVPARIAPDTFCVLLTGDAGGAEGLVLSRLVEAIAVHDAARPEPRSLALAVGTALYEGGSGGSLEAILEAADRRLAAQAPSDAG
jgi:diguanylate cyclase (GGDEF)-like protein